MEKRMVLERLVLELRQQQLKLVLVLERLVPEVRQFRIQIDRGPTYSFVQISSSTNALKQQQ